MTIILNGKTMELPDNCSLANTALRFTPDTRRIVAEVDGVIIDRTAWDTFMLKPGAVVELITFMGGG
jgi:thiamine biosynthesis protein ThiS